MIENTMAERSAPTGLEACKMELAAHGWTILGPHLLRDGARAALSQLGTIIPQFNDQDTFEVTLKRGFESLPYSQSKNAIGRPGIWRWIAIARPDAAEARRCWRTGSTFTNR
jgi:hypothetical protein